MKKYGKFAALNRGGLLGCVGLGWRSRAWAKTRRTIRRSTRVAQMGDRAYNTRGIRGGR